MMRYIKPFKDTDTRYPLLLSFSSAYTSQLVTLPLMTKASHFRERLCDSDWIRTNGPHLRRMTLYPAELPNPLLFLGCKFNEK